MEESKGDMMRDTNVFVCDACGFIFVGDSAPDICPVCKVPAFKFNRIERGA
jgi:rubrerythrin